MTSVQKNKERLLQFFQDVDAAVVAFSGGIDSTLVLAVAYEALGDKVVAVTGVSATTAEGELDNCKQIAQEVGAKHVIFDTPEMEVEEFIANQPDRCYQCKRVRLSAIRGYADDLGVSLVLDGSNADDVGDYRPGKKAVEEFGIVSPLAEVGMGKPAIRELAKEIGLSNWSQPSNPCLATRIAYGLPITSERMNRIDQAERWLRAQGIDVCRVRYHEGDLARIEVPEAEILRWADETFRKDCADEMEACGFSFASLDLRGFRSGSMNRSIEAADKEDNEDGKS
jgi:pyridinium-3,5-biscarboxylic acid mononucleotide sulfurtransferase